MEENRQHFQHIMLYYFKKGKNAKKKKKDLRRVWRRCYDLPNMSEVVCEVSCTVRPVEADSNQIKTLTENNQH